MDILKEKKDIKLEKIFIIFLILHLVVWSTICLIRQIMPIDAMECVYWGSFADFGTNKHPPLAGWMAYFVYNLFHKTDISIYLLGQVSIITGFIYLYKLGKIFIGKTASMLAVMIMEACFVYTYMGIYDGFNPNFLLLAFLPIITYYFYKSIHEDTIWNWIKLGIFVGLSFLAKYQTLMLFLPLFVYLLIIPKGREQFRKKGLYISATLAFLIVLPHLVWLINHEFFSLNYFVLCEERYATFYKGPLKYLWSPFIFLWNQFIAVVGTIFVYFFAMWFSKEKLSKEQIIDTDDKKFLICAGVCPIFLQSLNGLNGNYMIPQWGYSLLFLSSIMLFCFFPFKLTKKAVKTMVFWSFFLMFVSVVVLASVFLTEKNFANRFPVEQVATKLNNIYKSQTGQEMKYIGGFIELSVPLSLYNNGKYTAVLNMYKYPNLWFDENDMKKSGVIVVGRDRELMDGYIDTIPNVLIKPDIKPFMFTVKSAVGRERKYKMHYAIIPPCGN